MTLEWTMGTRPRYRSCRQRKRITFGRRQSAVWGGDQGVAGPCISGIPLVLEAEEPHAAHDATLHTAVTSTVHSSALQGLLPLSQVCDKCSLICKAESFTLCHSSYRVPTYFLSTVLGLGNSGQQRSTIANPPSATAALCLPIRHIPQGRFESPRSPTKKPTTFTNEARSPNDGHTTSPFSLSAICSVLGNGLFIVAHSFNFVVIASFHSIARLVDACLCPRITSWPLYSLSGRTLDLESVRLLSSVLGIILLTDIFFL